MGFYNVHNYWDHQSSIPACDPIRHSLRSDAFRFNSYPHGRPPHSMGSLGNNPTALGATGLNSPLLRLTTRLASSSALPHPRRDRHQLNEPHCEQAALRTQARPVSGLAPRRQSDCCTQATTSKPHVATDPTPDLDQAIGLATRNAITEWTIPSNLKRYQIRCLHPKQQEPTHAVAPAVRALATEITATADAPADVPIDAPQKHPSQPSVKSS